MAFVNYAAKEINCKIVYYGPGLGGKTTNVRYIHDRSNHGSTGPLISLATETERTLLFDFLPLEVGAIRGYRVRFHLYTVPGQIFYDASRKLILKGTDGAVLVADSQVERMDANLESIRNLAENLAEHSLDLRSLPYVLQLNKRDLPRAVPVREMVRQLRVKGEPVFEAVAARGIGVFDTLKGAMRLVMGSLKKR